MTETGKEPKVIFSKHAREHMKWRMIGEKQVWEAIFDPDVEMPGRIRGTVRVHKEIAGRRLGVIYALLGSGDRFVITAFWRSDEETPKAG